MKKRNILLATALLSVGSVFAQTLPDGMTALLPSGVTPNITQDKKFIMQKNLTVAGSPEKGYYAFFSVASGASAQHLEETSKGLPLSFIVSVIVLGPIQEELMFRGLLQGAIFENSWLGLVLTSSLFSFMHEPYDVPSFFYYLLGSLLLGFAYKKSQNLWVSTLVHMSYNSLPLLTYF